jgi:hypothetical protein
VRLLYHVLNKFEVGVEGRVVGSCLGGVLAQSRIESTGTICNGVEGIGLLKKILLFWLVSNLRVLVQTQGLIHWLQVRLLLSSSSLEGVLLRIALNLVGLVLKLGGRPKI